MEFNTFVGFDISKKTIDVAIRTKTTKDVLHQQFENTVKGFRAMLKWAKAQSGVSEKDMFFCMEHTGIYTLPIACFLSEKGLTFRLENPYHIKHSMGIQRGKNDKADSKMIARYAYLHHEEIKPTKFAPTIFIQLQTLLSHRERLVKTKCMYKVASKEVSEFTGKEIHTYIKDDSKAIIALLEEKLKAVEKEIEDLIMSDENLKKNYELAKSVKGIGPIITAYMLVYTQNFTTINDSRHFASYSGIAPFGCSSGTSIQKGTHVSHLANKRMKSLLNNGAWSASLSDKELKAYFDRKIKEGKPEMVVINAIRNKLVGRIFAAVKRGTPYIELYQHRSN